MVFDPLFGGRAVTTRDRLGFTLFLIAAAASFLLSTAIWFTDNKDDEAVFVGLWVRRSSRPAALAWSR